MEKDGINFRPPEVKKEITYKWTLYPGKRIFIKESLHGDREDWYPAEVEPDHKVIVGRGILRTSKGGGKIGYGVIKEIVGGSFFSGNILVSEGKEVRIFFKKKERLNQPKILNFPKIHKENKIAKEEVKIPSKKQKKEHFNQPEFPNFPISKNK